MQFAPKEKPSCNEQYQGLSSPVPTLRRGAAALTGKHPEMPFTSQTTLVVTLIDTMCLQTVPLFHWQETVR